MRAPLIISFMWLAIIICTWRLTRSQGVVAAVNCVVLIGLGLYVIIKHAIKK